MVKHVILWKLKEGYSEKEKEQIRQDAKKHLEGLKEKVPQIREIHVQAECLDTSTADLMLDSSFDTAEALKEYSGHPDHVAVADKYIRPFMELRTCLDYEV